MLDLLYERLRGSQYFIETELKDIENSFCLICNSKVLDLAGINIKFSNEVNRTALESMHASYFSLGRNDLYFIQFVTKENFNKWTFIDYYDHTLCKKINDTVALFVGIAEICGIDTELLKNYLISNADCLKSVLVTDYDDVVNNKLLFANLELLHPPAQEREPIKNIFYSNCEELSSLIYTSSSLQDGSFVNARTF